MKEKIICFTFIFLLLIIGFLRYSNNKILKEQLKNKELIIQSMEQRYTDNSLDIGKMNKELMEALDILEKGEINTYREKEHDLLMDIRFGKYQKEDGTFRDEFYEMLSDFEKRLNYAAENTNLPEEPDLCKVQDLVMTINESVVRDEI